MDDGGICVVLSPVRRLSAGLQVTAGHLQERTLGSQQPGEVQVREGVGRGP